MGGEHTAGTTDQESRAEEKWGPSLRLWRLHLEEAHLGVSHILQLTAPRACGLSSSSQACEQMDTLEST